VPVNQFIIPPHHVYGRQSRELTKQIFALMYI
jgi:hypothetical protein